MSCEVAALPFQAHANYGTWSIDFDMNLKDFESSLFHDFAIQNFLLISVTNGS
jgi:hypothetical protein